MKLLLAKIEAVCTDSSGGPSGGGEAPNFVPLLFRGQTSRCVTCATCGTASDSAKSRVDYYELEVYVRGHKALGGALADLLAPEHLTGENAYACGSPACLGTKQSASLATRVHAPPPPVLNINLKRFVFDAKTCSRKKVTDRFAFPGELDLAPYLTYDEDAAPGTKARAVVYDLTAVLLHKGQSASHGHYIALVKVAGTWWRFDDEDVVRLGQHPLGDTDDKKAAAEARKKAKAGKKGVGGKKNAAAAAGDDAAPAQGGKGGTKRKETAKGSIEAAFAGASKRGKGVAAKAQAPVPAPAEDDNDVIIVDGVPVAPQEAAALPPGGGGGGAAGLGDIPAGHYASTEAYLLIYEARRPATGDGQAVREEQAVPEVPQNVLAAVAAADAALAQRLAAATAKREDARQEIEARKELVRQLLPTAGVPVVGDDEGGGGEGDYHWVSSAWLGAWASDEKAPGPIDNGCIACPHGCLDPVKARTGAKRISREAWEVLSATYGLADGPQLPGGPGALCRQCAAEAAAVELSGRARADARAVLRGELEAVMKLQEPGAQPRAGDPSDVWVSRAWCTSWMKWQPSAAAEVAAPPPAAEAYADASEVIIISDDKPTSAQPPAAPPRKPIGAAVAALLRGLATGPATGLQCPHSSLLPDDGAVSRRVRVPAAMWTQLCAEARAAAAALARAGGEAAAAAAPHAAPVFPQFSAVTCVHCAQCDADAVAKDRATRLRERQALGALAKGTATVVGPPGSHLVAVPAAFLRAWRAYVLPGTTGPASLVASPRPRGNDPGFSWPKCEPHGAPLVTLPTLVRSTKAGKPWEAPLRVPGVDDEGGASGKEAADIARALSASLAEAGGVASGSPPQATSVMPLVLVTHEDGVTLGELYGAVEDGHGGQVVSCGAVVTVADASSPDAPPMLLCHPLAPCQPCCAVATAAAAAAACTYSRGSVSVTLQKPPRHMAGTGGGDSPGRGAGSTSDDDDYQAASGARGASKRHKVEVAPAENGTAKPVDDISLVHNPKVAAAAAAAARASAAAAGSTVPSSGVRASKRVRAGTAGGAGGAKQTVRNISSSDTLWQLKLLILQQFQVHPFDQMLFCAGRRVDAGTEADKSTTLGEAGIPTGASLFLVSTGHHDPDDVVGLVGDDVVPSSRRGAVEKGFQGTGLLLHGGPAADDPSVRIVEGPEDTGPIVVN